MIFFSFVFDSRPRAYRQRFSLWRICKYNRKKKETFDKQKVPKAENDDSRTGNDAARCSAGRAPLYNHHYSHHPYGPAPQPSLSNIPRHATAYTTQRPGSLPSGIISSLPYASPSSTSATTYVSDSVASHALMLTPHTPGSQYAFPVSQHPESRTDKLFDGYVMPRSQRALLSLTSLSFSLC